jgi:DNA-binding YbaB/EbfC family protein
MDFRHLLEQAKNLEKNLAKIDETLAQHETVGSASGVKVRMNGVGDVLALDIDPELIQSGDAELVSQAVQVAFRQALEATRKYREDQRADLTGGLKLPDF